LIANRQNRLEFILLAAEEWEDFANSTLRQNRLRILTEMGRQWGIMIGADVPIAGSYKLLLLFISHPFDRILSSYVLSLIRLIQNNSNTDGI
jgi:hypothetical protein